MRNNRGGVDIDSLMQMSEHYSAHAYGLGLLYTFLTQGTVSINRVVQDTLSQGWASGTGRTNAESNARGAAFSRLRERVGDAPPGHTMLASSSARTNPWRVRCPGILLR